MLREKSACIFESVIHFSVSAVLLSVSFNNRLKYLLRLVVCSDCHSVDITTIDF
jgi:hypothetical protein